MAKPNSITGYQAKWLELAAPIFENEGMDIRSGVINDFDIWRRALLRSFRSFLVECYVDDVIEKFEARFAGMTRQAVLALLVVDKHSWAFKEAYTSDRELNEAVLVADLSHWHLPDLAFRVAWGQVNGLPEWRSFLLPHCPDELRSHFE